MKTTMIEVVGGGAFKVTGGDEPPGTWFWRDSVSVMAPKPGKYRVDWDESQVSVTREEAVTANVSPSETFEA